MKENKLFVIVSLLLVLSASVYSITLEALNQNEAKANEDGTTLTTAISVAVVTNATTAPTIPPPKPNTEVCYEHVGCFDNKPPFDNAALYLPIPPEVLNTGIWLYTNEEQEDPEYLSYIDEDVIKNSGYNKQYPLKVIIHGFQNGGNETWIKRIRTNILKKEKNKVNVIVMDWVKGAPFPLYFNASANTRIVGRQTCLAIKLIRKVFYNDAWSKDFNIHCIGHSLGAHTCGYASKYCDNIFNRISAMDPAGPNFEGTPVAVRLDKTDAQFVDVIHSNADNFLTGNFGMQAAIGHVDFFPNGGKQQPGCPSLISVIGTLFSNTSAAASGVACSHARSYEIYGESITSPCTFLGYPCQDQATFEKGGCFSCGTQGCAQMGYFTSTKARGIKYLMTDSKTPYCAYPYMLEITISPFGPKTAGEISAILYSGDQNVTALLTKKTDDIALNETYRKVFATDIDIIDIDRLLVKFDKKNKPLFTADPNAPEVVIDKVKVLVGETDEIFSECVPNLSIRDKETVTINLNNEDCRLRAKQSNLKLFVNKFNN